MSKEVVIFIGPPGSGKGTQADLLLEEMGFYHLESSKVIEEKFKSAPANDEAIARERELWASGKLNSPEMVRELILERIREVATEGKSIVFSGSPRTLYEAEGEMPVLEELYEPQHIHVLHLEIGEEESVRRNSKRRICAENRHPIPNLPSYEKLTKCPKDGSELITRALDTEDTIRVRFKEYLARTAPVLKLLEDRGYAIVNIDGDTTIETVHSHVADAIQRQRLPAPK